MKFFERMLTQFFARHMPDSTQAKPRFMKNTSMPVTSTQTVSAPTLISASSRPRDRRPDRPPLPAACRRPRWLAASCADAGCDARSHHQQPHRHASNSGRDLPFDNSLDRPIVQVSRSRRIRIRAGNAPGESERQFIRSSTSARWRDAGAMRRRIAASAAVDRRNTSDRCKPAATQVQFERRWHDEAIAQSRPKHDGAQLLRGRAGQHANAVRSTSNCSENVVFRENFANVFGRSEPLR